MLGRRLEDRTPEVMLADFSVAELRAAQGSHRLPVQDRAGPGWPQAGQDAPLFVLRDESGDLFGLTGAELWRQSAQPGLTSTAAAAALAEELRTRYASVLRKKRFQDGFVIFVERLNRAESVLEVYDAVLDQVPHLLEAYAAVLLVPGAPGWLDPIRDSRLPPELTGVHATELQTRPVPVVLGTDDVAAGSPFEGLAPLFTQTRARQLICTGMGERGLLVLVERRSGRDLSGEEWFRLQAVAHHAQRAVERLQPRAVAASVAVSVN